MWDQLYNKIKKIVKRLYYAYLCSVDKHEGIYIAQQLTKTTARLYCPKCGKSFAMSADLSIMLEWTYEFVHLYRDIYKVPIVYLPEEHKI